MTLPQFYGLLATTASIFVGILTAYLITHISDLKSERERLEGEIDIIRLEGRAIQRHYNFRQDVSNKWEKPEISDSANTYNRDSSQQMDNGDVVDTLWDISDREVKSQENLRRSHHSENLNRMANREAALVVKYNSLGAKQLRSLLQTVLMPILLSVILPLLVRFLYEVGWELGVPSGWENLEPIVIFVLWLVGFLWTIKFLWGKINEEITMSNNHQYSSREFEFPGEDEVDKSEKNKFKESNLSEESNES